MVSGQQMVIFVLGWLAYASTYFLRKPLGLLKVAIERDLGLTTAQLGLLDASLLLPYAVAQIAFGSLGDTFGPQRIFGFCLIASGLSMVTFGLWSSVEALCLLLFLNGLAQCWPNCTKILSCWFTDGQKNSVFGLFGTCAFAGGIIGTGLAVYLENKTGSWRAVHTIPSIIVASFGILVLLFYRECKEARLQKPADEDENALTTSSSSPHQFRELIRLPAVIEISVAVFCLKLVRYCMYMWMPLYLEKQLGYPSTSAGLFSTMFEIGGVIGSALCGALIDKYSPSRPLLGVTFSITASAASLVLFNATAHWGYASNSLCMFLSGAFNCGPDTILGAAVPNKIGQQDKRDCSAAVTGVVNGFGSLGTVIEGPLIAWLSGMYGWSRIFPLMVVLTLLGAAATIKASPSIRSTIKSEDNHLVV
ncbi:sugar phosphate exchanger 3-like isoform X2 [Watersipora subatra]|uniref:sugar phosphate exchanger 3-like isoform X2 n=1 Tax=Watersipora subatra TaxID=2589382 RepID=UPI00355B7FB8